MDNKIFEKIFREEDKRKVDTLLGLTEYYIQQGKNLFKATELAEDNLSNFITYSNELIANSKLNNLPCIFKFVNKDVIITNSEYYFILQLYHNLQNIEWKEFELLSAIILEVCFGALNVSVTQSTVDGGVDFTGMIPIRPIASENIYGYIEVYGQSKKYTGNIGIEHIRSFVGVANRKKRNFIHPPQIFIYCTTSDFASNALKELVENKFLGFSGLQLANMIYQHKSLLNEKYSNFNWLFDF